jgi:hypothetical protein
MDNNFLTFVTDNDQPWNTRRMREPGQSRKPELHSWR